MKYISIVFLVILLGAALYWTMPKKVEPQPTACTLEAKVCPDGSAVGRTGPNCEFAECPAASPTVSLPADVTLGVGEKQSVGGLTLTLVSIAQDSRCPADVQCFWAGVLVAKVSLAGEGVVTTKEISSGEAPLVFAGLKVSLSGATPAPKSTVTIPESAYRVTFHVSK